MPRDAAVSVPNANPSSAVAYSHSTSRPAAAKTAVTVRESHRDGAIDPNSQCVMARVVSASLEAIRTR
jgi:hypothetical protein